jgi:CBS domain-containing protein
MDRALGLLFALVNESGVDVLVAEAGASPLEPYNGEAAVAGLGEPLLCVLCASDPYAVLGVQTAFGITPDLVSGRAASTDAGVALAERLTGIRTLNLLDSASHGQLDRLLAGRVHPSEGRVREWMTAEPVAVSAATPIEAAVTLMTEYGFHHLPVVLEERPIGMLGLRQAARRARAPSGIGLGF